MHIPKSEGPSFLTRDMSQIGLPFGRGSKYYAFIMGPLGKNFNRTLHHLTPINAPSIRNGHSEPAPARVHHERWMNG
jgi:hypothetical protein